METERLATLVNDLFTLARADADERAFTPVRVQLDEIVLEAVTTAGWIAVAARHHARRRGGRGGGDRRAMRRCCGSSCSSCSTTRSSSATRAARSTISVRADRRRRRRSTVRRCGRRASQPRTCRTCSIASTARRARAARPSGRGLGLAIAKWITDVHGAQIAIAPAPERGTRVIVRFPIAAPDAACSSVTSCMHFTETAISAVSWT